MRRGKAELSIVLPELPPLDDAPVIAAVETVAEKGTTPFGSVPDAGVNEVMASFAGKPMHTLDMRPLAMWERTATVAAMLSASDVAVRELLAGSAYPFAAYDRFRRDNPVRPPPGPMPSASGLSVIVDASVAAPFLIRETLRSLQRQAVRGWRAIVVAPEATRAHPIASFGDIDPRFTFVDAVAFVRPEGPALVLSAGTALDPQALAWFAFAADRIATEAIFADHDHGVLDVDLGALGTDPWFYGAYDRAAIGWVPSPAAVWASAALLARVVPEFDGGDGWRRGLLAAAQGGVPHVARVLATVLELPIAARGGRETALDDKPGRLGPIAPLSTMPLAAERDDRIAVIIPTRDGAGLLRRAVETLRATARDPGRLDIVVVDNRSVDSATEALFAEFQATGAARRHTFDRAFNWGLANNEGAKSGDAPFVVFANNDIEMLARGWDDILVEALSDPSVGGVGARLLYPNRTIQHGGIVFGMVPWHTEHEGRGVAASDPGPNRRLATPRTVGGVTGAFLGVRRDAFEAVGGIDVVMGVAHSDIDLCLKLRECGLTILYEPRIEAIHFESVTRGFNSTKADVAWDESERGDLVARWGASMVEDVGVSPYWSRTGTPFETIREPSMVEIVRHLDRTARALPWAPSRREAQQAAMWRAEALGDMP